MSLEYYLYCKKSYNKIMDKLDSIIDIIEELGNAEDENNKNSLLNHKKHKTFFINKKSHITGLTQLCNTKIMKLCKHEIVEDDLDLTPERSQKVRYCTICEYTI